MRRSEALSVGHFGVFLVVVLGLTVFAPAGMADDETTKVELAVLYAGNPGSERMDDFEALLKEHFRRVGTANFEAFEPEHADDFDVVIFDWTSIYPRNEQGRITWENDMALTQPTVPKLDRSFTRPCVMIGAAAGSLSWSNAAKSARLPTVQRAQHRSR